VIIREAWRETSPHQPIVAADATTTARAGGERGAGQG